MKNLKIYLAAALLAVLTSCGGGMATSDSTNDGTNNTNSAGRQGTLNSNTSTNVNTNRQSTINEADVNRNDGNRNSTSGNGSMNNSNKNNSTMNNSSMNNSTSPINNRNVDANRENLVAMYKSLGMNDDQVSRYEMESVAQMESWKKANPTQPMDNIQMEESRNRTIQPILTKEQYIQYQRWSKDNAQRQ